jgi:PAS domain S-box-containing protein
MEEDLKRRALAIDHSSETIMITSTNGIIIYVNPSFEKITGYSQKEAVGKNPNILKSGNQDKSLYRKLWGTISNGKTWSGRFINKKKDGSEYTEEATISPVFSDKGKIVNYVAVKRDVTEQLRLEAQLQQAQKMESLGTLAGGIAHDFNNILSPIIGFTELALGEVDKDSNINDDLQEILKAGMRAKDLVKQILTFARQTEDETGPIRIDIIVKEVLEFIKNSIPSTIQISADINSDSLIMGSSGKIHQILMNLCTNAFHAMEKNGGILGVRVKDVIINKNFKIPDLELRYGEYIQIKAF